MVDKVTTVPKTGIGSNVGRLADEDMVRLNRALLVFSGIAAPTENEELCSRNDFQRRRRASLFLLAN